jgi:hypothetical protein
MADQVADVEMEERLEPKLISFSDGDICQGILTLVEKATVKDKLCVRYTVARTDGTEVCFLGTHQLNKKLKPDDCGHKVEIICTGEDQNVKRGDNCMKTFNVKVSKKLMRQVQLPPVQESEVVLEITDNDIPF